MKKERGGNIESEENDVEGKEEETEEEEYKGVDT